MKITMSYNRVKHPVTKFRLFRFLVQLFFLFILNAAAFRIADIFLPLPLPINFPHGPYSIIEGAFYTTQRVLIYTAIPFVTLASFLLIGSLVGRLFCSWVCPFGTVQDLVGFIRPNKHIVNRNTDRGLYENFPIFYLAIVILFSAVIGFSAILGGPESYQDVVTQFTVISDIPGAVLDPSSTLFGAIPYWIFIVKTFPTELDGFLQIDIIFWLRLIILFTSIIFPLFYVNRFYCRYVCPTGYIMGKIGKNSILGINRNMTKCNDCGLCDKACTMGIRITELPAGRIRHQNCILCLDCVNVCPEDALSLSVKDN